MLLIQMPEKTGLVQILLGIVSFLPLILVQNWQSLDKFYYKKKGLIGKNCKIADMSELLNNKDKANNKNELKKIQSDLKAMKNKINHLRQKQMKQKLSIQRNKQKAKAILARKIMLSELDNYPKTNPEQQQQQLQLKKKINQNKKMQHQKQLDSIKKAIYLVKVDDANQIRSTSINHKRKLEQIKTQSVDLRKQRRIQAYKASEKRKQRHIHYIKARMMSIASEKNKDQSQVQNIKIQKLAQLQYLEKEEAKLTQILQKMNSDGMLAKKQYYIAKSIPLRSVASSLQKNYVTNSPANGEKRMHSPNQTTHIRSNLESLDIFDKKDMRIKNNDVKLPNTNLDETKLRSILEQLKRRQPTRNKNSE